MNDISKMIADLESRRATIDRAIAALRDISAAGPKRGRKPGSVVSTGEPKTRRLSPEGRERIAAAARRRWAAARAAKEGGSEGESKPKAKKGR